MRELFLALNIFALVLASSAGVGAATMTSAAAGTQGVCAHCRGNSIADHAQPTMPLCGLPACAASAIMAPAPQPAASLFLSSADYAIDPAAPLSGGAPPIDPPPPRSILVL